MAQDLDLVRHELTTRIVALDVRARPARAHELAVAIDEIRALAHDAGMNTAVTVIHFIASALARGEHGAGVHGWLHMLKDAVGAERQDNVACDAFAAACAVRLAA